MKKIEFGYSNSSNPTGSYEGMGIKPNSFLTEAEYYGSAEFEDNYYIIAKVVEDEYNKFPQLLNNFIVRQALCDLYADGSGILMLNQEETQITIMLENHLNNSQYKEKITTIEDVINLSNGLHKSSNAFMLLELTNGAIIPSTSIIPEAFERKNEALKAYTNHSFSDLSEELLEKENNYII